MPSLLIASGGWDGHKPHEVAKIVSDHLSPLGFDCTLADSTSAFLDAANYDLVMPNFTMHTAEHAEIMALLKAVEGGVGCIGLHGGMGDAFRNSTEYQFMTGGQFVAHPGDDGRVYGVRFTDHPLAAGLNDFQVSSEKYYMHVDPANTVVAYTEFEEFGNVRMPVVWTKSWGMGRVFYCSLGHSPAIVAMPVVLEIMTRGAQWAARK